MKPFPPVKTFYCLWLQGSHLLNQTKHCHCRVSLFQDKLGEIVYVELPEVDAEFEVGGQFNSLWDIKFAPKPNYSKATLFAHVTKNWYPSIHHEVCLFQWSPRVYFWQLFIIWFFCKKMYYEAFLLLIYDFYFNFQFTIAI